MGTLYDNFEAELAVLERRYSDSTTDELVALCLLALEREELVSVGYREDVLSPRLSALRVSGEVREIIHHALVWTWKDEEMHTIYIRGAILKVAEWPLRMNAFCRQLAGAVGGWSASVQQHVSWSAAPLCRTSAALVTFFGSLTGKVPREVKRHLTNGPFRDFCSFNVDAEKTAWLCWKRMVELAEQTPGLSPNTVADFRRVQADEERHQRIFQILADALDANDELVTGETPESLSRKIGEVGEYFLPRRFRGHLVARNPLGSGGNVWVMEGKDLEEKLSLFRRMLDESGLADHIRNRSRECGKEVRQLKIAIKPTFMLGYDRRDTSIITDPQLLDSLASYLREIGCVDIAAIEARNIYDRFFQSRSVDAVSGYFGFRSPNYRVVDGTEEQIAYAYLRGLAQYSVSRTWKEADFRISFGKMRSHPIELAYLTVGNVEWMGGRCDEFVFVERQAQRETAIMMLLDGFPPQFAILDAFESAADGLVGVMGCPRPKRPLRFYAGSDALAVDTVAARHMRVLDPRKSSLLRAACHWFGNSDNPVQVIGTDKPLNQWKDPYHNETSTLLSLLAFPVYVMGSGRGSMFLPEMDVTAFPLIRPESMFQRFSRRTIRSMLGLRHPK
jgi:uncharacterized protein (DUF362 family)